MMDWGETKNLNEIFLIVRIYEIEMSLKVYLKWLKMKIKRVQDRQTDRQTETKRRGTDRPMDRLTDRLTK